MDSQMDARELAWRRSRWPYVFPLPDEAVSSLGVQLARLVLNASDIVAADSARAGDLESPELGMIRVVSARQSLGGMAEFRYGPIDGLDAVLQVAFLPHVVLCWLFPADVLRGVASPEAEIAASDAYTPEQAEALRRALLSCSRVEDRESRGLVVEAEMVDPDWLIDWQVDRDTVTSVWADYLLPRDEALGTGLAWDESDETPERPDGSA